MSNRLFPPGSPWSLPLKGVKLKHMQEMEKRLLISLETEDKKHLCPACGSSNLVGYGRMTWRIRDLPIDNKWVLLDISRRRLRCKNCRVTFNEPVAYISSAHRTTTRLAQRLWQLALYHPFAAIAAQFGLDEKTLRNIFQDRFVLAMAQLRRQTYPQTPQVLVLQCPFVQRQQRVLWLNREQATLIDLTSSFAIEELAASLQRLCGTAASEPSWLWVPPEPQLIQALKTVLQSRPDLRMCLHPAALRSCLKGILAKPINGPEDVSLYTKTLQEVICGSDVAPVEASWQHLLAMTPKVSAYQAVFEAISLLGADAFAAFGEPADDSDEGLEQLQRTIETQFARRSFDALCAMLLCDKGLQVSARTGRADDGAHLHYQKAHYGTSLGKLLAKLTTLPELETKGAR